MISLKRIYEPYNEKDGIRILVDRLWPRGIAKEKAKINYWLKEIAPSQELRKWFCHDPKKYEEFQTAYYEELRQPEKMEVIEGLVECAKTNNVTLLYGAKDEVHNQAMVLKKFLDELMVD